MKLVFTHGWCTDKWVWEELAKEYGPGAIVLDLPGHGAPARWDEPTIIPAVKEIESLLDSLGEEPVVGIGWSLGAQALLSAASKRQRQFMALVLVGATPCFTSREDFPWGQSPALVKKMIDEMKKNPAPAVERFLKLNFTEEEAKDDIYGQFIDRYKYPGPVSCSEGDGHPPGCHPGFDYDGITRALESLVTTDLRAVLPEIDIPTLVVHGEKDQVCPVAAGKYLHENIKDSRLITFDAGHAPFLTHPIDFRIKMEEFLRST